MKERFKSKVGKISIDTSFGCEHKALNGGCIFCNLSSYRAPYIVNEDIRAQWQKGKDNYKNRYEKYYAYFQLGTPLSKGVSKMSLEYAEKLIEYEDSVGLMFGARSDMLEESTLKTLNDLAIKTQKEIWLEIGLQSSNDETLKYINRGHNYESFVEAVNLIDEKYKNIFVCAHIIFGLPKNDTEIESEEEMLKTIKDVSSLKVAAVKFHQLQVVKGSDLEFLYYKKHFETLSEEYYIDLIVKAISLTNPNMIISRLMGDSLNDTLIAPIWRKSKGEIINSIEKKLKEENLFQGYNLRHN